MTSFDGYDDDYLTSEAVEPAGPAGDIDADLSDLIEIIRTAKQMPLSNSALIARDEVLGLLTRARENLPDEIREARWALRDREELMAAEVHKANQLMDQVRAEAARMVERTEIVRQSRQMADQIIAEAEARARQMINQAEDFIDGKLGNFEIVLERLLKTARSGRERLNAHGLPTSLLDARPGAEFLGEAPAEPSAPAPAPAPSHEDTSFFDQDAP